MQKKVFLTKNAPPRRYPYFKLFLGAALALMALVLITPLLTRQKPNKGVSMKPSPERGAIVREIPKSEAPFLERMAQGEEKSEVMKGGEKTVASIPEFKGFPEPQEKTVPTQPADKLPESGSLQRNSESAQILPGKDRVAETEPLKPSVGPSPSTRAGKAPPAENEMAALTPSKPESSISGSKPPAGVPSASLPPASGSMPVPAEPTSPAAKPNTVPEKQKPAPGGSKLLYIIQVGSFKEKQNADELQRSLQKKGYEAVIKPQNHPKLGQLFVVQLQPVADVRKANTLMTQVGHEEKVRPFIIKVPEVQ